MSFKMRNDLTPTLIVSLLITLLLSQRHFGFMLAFLLLLLIPGFAYSCYRCVRFPVERKLIIQKAVIWCVAVIVIASVHLVMYQTAKSYAQGVSEKIEAYISDHGRCPAALDDIGISKSTFKEHLGRGRYDCKDRQPFLFYASTYLPFSTENYDFTKHAWRSVNN